MEGKEKERQEERSDQQRGRERKWERKKERRERNTEEICQWSGVKVCGQRFSSAFDLLLIFPCSLIQTLPPTPTPPPNNANMKCQ